MSKTFFITREDKGKIMAWGYGLSVIGLAALLTFGILPAVNLWWLIGILGTYIMGLLMPQIVYRYVRLNEQDPSWRRYLPFLSEYEIFTPLMARVVRITHLVTVILFVLGTLPLLEDFLGTTIMITLLTSTIGETAAMSFSFYMYLSALSLYFIMNIPRGLAYVEVKRNTDRIYRRHFGPPPANRYEKSYLLFLFVPVLRVLPLMFLNERLRKMVDIYDLNLQDREDFTEIK